MENNELYCFGDLSVDELMQHSMGQSDTSNDENVGEFTSFGDTPVDELAHDDIQEDEESDCFGDAPVSSLTHDDADVENDEVCCFGDLSINDLEHSGIKGMKWGIRRYQNKDGSLTPAGKKRYNQELAKVREAEKVLKAKQATKAKIDRLNARKKAVEEGEQELESVSGRTRIKPKKGAETSVTATPKKKTAIDMTDDELRKSIERLNLEKQYNTLQSELNPKKASRGKTFMEKFKDEVINKLATSVAADLVAQTAKTIGAHGINKALNATINDGDEEKTYVHTNNKK